MQVHHTLRQGWRASSRSAAVFAADVGRGLLAVSRNTLALVGLVATLVVAFALGRPELRHGIEQDMLQWLQSRHEARELASGNLLAAVAEPEAVHRATATDARALSEDQRALAHWIARRYKVAPDAVGALVVEAWALGERARLDPTLILAIVAVESSFNPFAQSPMGAQGLMQVMTHIHDDKYEPFGGTRAAFDPIANLRVGVQVLRECIARGGSVAEGLRFYVGAALLPHDGGYGARVMLEQAHMRAVAEGRNVPVTVSNTPPARSDEAAEANARGAVSTPAVAPAAPAASGAGESAPRVALVL